MGFLDRLKEMAGKHSDKVDEGVTRAADEIDERTGGKYSEQIDQAEERAKEAMRRGESGDEQQPPA